MQSRIKSVLKEEKWKLCFCWSQSILLFNYLLIIYFSHEALTDVTKQKDMSGFYRYLYRQTDSDSKANVKQESNTNNRLGNFIIFLLVLFHLDILNSCIFHKHDLYFKDVYCIYF